MSDEEKAREYRLEVKKRLFGPYRVRFKSLSSRALLRVFKVHTKTLGEDDFLTYSEVCQLVSC